MLPFSVAQLFSALSKASETISFAPLNDLFLPEGLHKKAICPLLIVVQLIHTVLLITGR
jgi:hypothetical protein